MEVQAVDYEELEAVVAQLILHCHDVDLKLLRREYSAFNFLTIYLVSLYLDAQQLFQHYLVKL